MSVLAGLTSVDVEIAALSPEAEAFQLTTTDLEQVVKRALRTTTLRLAGGAAGEVGGSKIVVEVRAVPVRGTSHLYSVELALREYVRTERALPGLETFYAPTWTRFTMGIANSPVSVVNAVSTLAEAFAAEHRSENR
ncbi:hypothetical protein ASA1KI_22180 [Opitutales bacterium ASA1]|uniref:hypothetical protein n=1 Tax=Congregicoccus parvus TaxID=3081749 RepID=UPI002B2E8DE5|nr:hypothetical protein ASA1KI_22180 [Opitutales bacterium ASA1]